LSSYDAFVEYSENNDNCRVPLSYTENKDLATWVNTQRRKQKENTLHPNCKERLDAIGFNWISSHNGVKVKHPHINCPPEDASQIAPANKGLGPEEAEWQNFFDQLKAYKSTNGTWAPTDEMKEKNKPLVD